MIDDRPYTFEDTPQPGERAKSAGKVFPGGVVGDTDDATGEPRAYRDRAASAKVHHMRIALQEGDEIGRILDLIEENEEKASELVRAPVEFSMFSLSGDTEAKHAEVVRLLAENGTLFAKLFGRDIGGKPTPASLSASKAEPKTTGDLLHSMQADAHLVAAGDAEAKDRRKARKPATSIAKALGLS